jgi:hypothetical protein
MRSSRLRCDAFGQRMWASAIRSQILVSLAIGAAAAFTVLGTGLSVIKFHGGIWPWWFHGIAVALITGLITTLLTHLQVREVRRREARMLTGERMSHEICTALQILVQCRYSKGEHGEVIFEPDQRMQWEGEAIERLRVAARELLPNLLDIPIDTDASSTLVPDKKGRKAQD